MHNELMPIKEQMILIARILFFILTPELKLNYFQTYFKPVKI